MATYPRTGKLSDASNEVMLDTIHNEASLSYQNRVPRATKAGVEATLNSLVEYRPRWNEFVSALINRIGLVVGRSNVYSNPLKEFKKGVLNYGDTVEEYQMGLIKAYNISDDHEYGEAMLFGTHKVQTQSSFHTINRTDMYPITVNEMLLRRAFLQEGGLSKFVTDLMAVPTTSDNVDEFKLMTNLISRYDAYDGYHRVQIPEVADIDSTADDARRALRIMRATIENMRFPSTRYNPAKMPTWVNADDLVIFTTPEFRAAMDVEALAAAYNIDRAEVPNRIITLPKDEFNIPNGQAVVTSSDFFQVYDTLLENTAQENAVKLQTNYFLHHHSILSVSRFVPAVLLTTDAGDEVINITHKLVSIDDITITDVDGNEIDPTTGSVERGMVYQVEADVTVDPADDKVAANYGIVWRVQGAESLKTSMTQHGVLKVSPTEPSDTLTIVAIDSAADKVLESITLELEDVGVSGESAPKWPAGDPVEGDEDEDEPVEP